MSETIFRDIEITEKQILEIESGLTSTFAINMIKLGMTLKGLELVGYGTLIGNSKNGITLTLELKEDEKP